MDYERLYKEAAAARGAAYCPYSRFAVGCAVLLDQGGAGGGVYVRGSNVENASYGGCICAERVALVKCVTEWAGTPWACMGIVGGLQEEGQGDPGSKLISPCGICRQFIREFAIPEFPIVMFTVDGSQHKTMTLAELLPESFGPDHLQQGSVKN
ncbi:cytidine deaminase KNAG_0A02700 [Huiozyma naganishii CBS 8797]|uniref:Cytidine deaminase n=1 Tax=Huiozyma naganishii (strain ATCC MYA-139 / BCRC 22969 / CBS 8797 / KCTC 17520 / NBRC 10181 / NCYC 3082 / Yp74L-3) TaxID=1071383 RepID=J7S248_HUIN7|nr:hypothetical protein KNAG_0A02700 [Kazachstania naganishii CBS 8797]CCK67959.1 hypothetical protein KNAG_0A02700 [Kazachstania naganishii CBS 8797]